MGECQEPPSRKFKIPSTTTMSSNADNGTLILAVSSLDHFVEVLVRGLLGKLAALLGEVVFAEFVVAFGSVDEDVIAEVTAV